ncbi:MAG TPA: alpha/beta hydrolase-fold protein, partial [Kineosporiaceae bacterium]|nr:alpha/beta hydrolase-fold protein [Kineosporiaceae bacterium]
RFGFFADWSDLTGAVGLESQDSRSADGPGGGGGAGRPDAAAGRIADDAAVFRAMPWGGLAKARVVRLAVTGERSRIRGTVEVTLPPGYYDPRRAAELFPVIEAFPGYPGGPFNPYSAVRSTVTAQGMADAVIISPSVEIPAGRDTECVDGTGNQPKIETWLTEDLPAWTLRTLRVRADRESWAALGWSSGGWCAAMAAMLHPDRFSAAIVLGGYFRPEFGSLYRPFDAASPQGRRYDLVALAGDRPPPVSLWVQTSHADHVSYPTSSQFLAKARAPLTVHSLVLEHAGHRVGVWQPLLPESLTWLGRTARGFDPHRIAARQNMPPKAPTASTPAHGGSGNGPSATSPTASPTTGTGPGHDGHGQPGTAPGRAPAGRPTGSPGPGGTMHDASSVPRAGTTASYG